MLSSVTVENNAILKHGEQFADYLKKGLSDNWSQVRFLSYVKLNKINFTKITKLPTSCIIIIQSKDIAFNDKKIFYTCSCSVVSPCSFSSSLLLYLKKTSCTAQSHPQLSPF